MDVGALSTARKVLTWSSLDTESARSLKLLLAAKLKIVPGGPGGAGDGGTRAPKSSALMGHLSAFSPGALLITESPEWPG